MDSLTFEKKLELVRRKNEAEEDYIRALQNRFQREVALDALREVATEEHVAEIRANYQKRLQEGDHAVRVDFDLDYDAATELSDGRVLFPKAKNRIVWLKKGEQLFHLHHIFGFAAGKVASEISGEGEPDLRLFPAKT